MRDATIIAARHILGLSKKIKNCKHEFVTYKIYGSEIALDGKVKLAELPVTICCKCGKDK